MMLLEKKDFIMTEQIDTVEICCADDCCSNDCNTEESRSSGSNEGLVVTHLSVKHNKMRGWLNICLKSQLF